MSLSGSQSVWQIRWDVIVFANKTENHIYVVHPSNKQTGGSEVIALTGPGWQGHTLGPKRSLLGRQEKQHSLWLSQALHSNGQAKTHP